MVSPWPTWESIALTLTMINLIFLFKCLTNIYMVLNYYARNTLEHITNFDLFNNALRKH